MNKVLSRISVRVIMILLIVTLLLTNAVYFYWDSSVLPGLLRSEQTKADLLLSQYAKQLEQKLSAGVGAEEIELLLDEILLLRDSTTKQPLVLSIEMEAMDGARLLRSNYPEREITHKIVSDTAIFSPLDQMMFGTLSLQYNDAFFEQTSDQIGTRLFVLLIFILALLIMFALVVEIMLKPLSDIATSLNHMRVGKKNGLPEISISTSWEISYVHQSIGRLLAELRVRERELVDEHTRVEQALQEKLDAERASKAKSRFLANMSHELRTPLNAILGYSEMVLEELVEMGVDNGLRKDLQNIRGSGKHLLSLINDILDISKIEADRLQIFPTKVDVIKLMENIVGEIQPMADINNNNLTFEYGSICPVIETDEMRLKQIILNLLSNACKFTRNGDVRLTMRFLEEGERIQFEVMDTGIGIAESVQERVFDAFVQEDNSTTRNFEGTGLGLTISKKLSNILGGDITVASKVGEGSVFTVWLPKDFPHLSSQAGGAL